jgi:hypothetical protein
MNRLVEAAALASFVLGLTLIIGGVARCDRQLRCGQHDPARALGFARGLRLTLLGMSLAGLGIAILFDLRWLLVLSLVFGGQEMCESSVIIAALRYGAAGRPPGWKVRPPPLRMPTADTAGSSLPDGVLDRPDGPFVNPDRAVNVER